MKIGACLALGVLSLALVPPLPSVERIPDFSGTWVLTRNDFSFQPTTTGAMPGGAGGGFPGGGGGMPGGGPMPGAGGGMGSPGGGMPPGGGFPAGGPRGGNQGGGATAQPGAALPEVRLIVSQSPAELRTEHRMGPDGKFSVARSFALDGRQNTNPEVVGWSKVVSKAVWKKSRLVVDGERIVPEGSHEPRMTILEELSVSKDGRTLRIETTVMTPQGIMRIDQRFQKQ